MTPPDKHSHKDRRSSKKPHRPASTHRAHRFISRDGRVNVKRQGIRYHHPRDWYHWMLTLSLTQLSLVVGIGYFAINIFFALLYLADPGGIVGAQAGYFWDAFFFSVHTLSTLGYSAMVPHSLFTNWVVATESLAGLASFGFVAGVMFSRLSRPSARVMFSHYAIVAPYEGTPTFMFRAANRRGNQILNAEIHVSLTRNEKTLEGEFVRRVYDMRLLRATSSFFNLTWTVRHPIDELSPLHGQTPGSLRESETEIVVLLSGIDDVYGQMVHGRFAFNHEEILFGYRFANMFGRDENNQPMIDYAKFDAVEPVPEDEGNGGA